MDLHSLRGSKGSPTAPLELSDDLLQCFSSFHVSSQSVTKKPGCSLPSLQHLKEANWGSQAVEVRNIKVESNLVPFVALRLPLLSWPETQRIFGSARGLLFALAAEAVEVDGGSQRMTDKVDLALELRVSLLE